MFYFLAILTGISLALSWETKNYTDGRAALAAAAHGFVALGFGVLTTVVWLVERGQL